MATKEKEPSGWAIGWTAFTAMMMIMAGFWWMTTGFIAIFTRDFYAVTQKWILQFDPSTWGWIHLVMGLVFLIVGFGLFSGAVWARTVGVIVAILSALAAFAWLPYYPVWAILFIIAAIAIIWSLTVHGRDIAEF
jgi:hypothetical protein